MTEMIAKCGLVCTECPAFIATMNNDNELRTKTAAEWSIRYRMEFTADMLVCVGCLSTGGRLATLCAGCGIRNCPTITITPNCAYCGDYPCETFARFVRIAPEAKAKLDAIRMSALDDESSQS